jgi:two-component system sensor histidine kinase/response regulator
MPEIVAVPESPVVPPAPAPAMDESLLDRLRGVAGLQVEAGLRTVRGKLPSYLRLLEQFVRYHRDDAGRARQSLALNQPEQTQRIAHSLKGVAGNLGLLMVGEQAAALERAIREECPAAECLALIEALERVLETVVEALALVLPALQSTSFPEAGIEGVDLRAILRELMTLLNEDDLNAVSYYQQRAGLIAAALGERSAALAAHIEQYQFEEALQILKAAQELLSAPSSL